MLSHVTPPPNISITPPPLPYPLSPDLRHVAVMPGFGETTHPTNCRPATSSSQNPEVPLGSAIPPVPLLLVERIESGAFIELADLIPTHLGFENTTRSKSKHRSVANISEWLQAFAVYVSVIARREPHRIPDLMGYQILMIDASNEYRNNGWLAYDRRFRQQAAFRPQCKWSNIDSTLWTLAFTGQAKANRCRHCFSLFHLSQDCEFAPNSNSSLPEVPHTGASRTGLGRRRFVCHQWNHQPSQTCSYPNCRFEHVCSICTINSEAKDIYHKAIFCPYRPTQNQQLINAQKPRPLFP